ncbi:MAG: DedA family protein [Acidobacteriota bacterium]|nr:DedA family protein [Acidobacteriota bacterium]
MTSYAALAVWSFLAATVLPLGSEPMVVLMISQGFPLGPVVTVATIGNTLGSFTTYGIGRLARRAAVPSGRSRRALALVEKYGAPALLLSWVPVVGDAIVAAAGLARMPFVRFALLTAAGKLARYLLLAYGASALMRS